MIQKMHQFNIFLQNLHCSNSGNFENEVGQAYQWKKMYIHIYAQIYIYKHDSVIKA